MVRVARRRHRQAAKLGVFEGELIVSAQGSSGVEDLERVDRQGLQSRKTDPGPEQIVGVRRNGQAAAFVDEVADFACRPPLEIGKRRADAEQVPFRGRDLDAGEDKKIVHRHAVLAHEAFFQKVGDAVVGVVIGQGKAVQALGFGRGDVLLGTGNAVARKERMRVQVDLEGHARERSLRAAKCKGSVLRNGPWFATRSGRGNRA